MNQRLKFESRPSSPIEINPEIITMNEGTFQETSWDTMEWWDTEIHCSEHRHKCDMDIQLARNLRVAEDLGEIHLELGINFFPQIHIKYKIHIHLLQQEW